MATNGRLSEAEMRAVAELAVETWATSDARGEHVREVAVAVGEFFLSAKEGIAREIIDELEARGVSVSASLIADIEQAQEDLRAIDEALADSGAACARHRVWRLQDTLRKLTTSLRLERGAMFVAVAFAAGLAAPLLAL